MICNVKLASANSVNNVSLKSNTVVNVNEIIGGTQDYDQLFNLPRIENVELKGNRNLTDFGIGRISNTELEELLK